MNISLNPAEAMGGPFARSFRKALRVTSARMRVVPPAENKHCLPKGAIFVVRRPMHRAIECLRGVLWVTLDGDPRDVIVESGQLYRPDRDAGMLVQALSESEFSFVSVVPSDYLQIVITRK